MKNLMLLGILALAVTISSCEKEDLTPAKQSTQPVESVDFESANARQKDPPKFWSVILFDQGSDWWETKKLSTALWAAGGGVGSGAPPGQGMDEYFYENASALTTILDVAEISGVIDGSLIVSGIGDHNLPVGSMYQLLFHDMSGELVATYEYEIVSN